MPKSETVEQIWLKYFYGFQPLCTLTYPSEQGGGEHTPAPTILQHFLEYRKYRFLFLAFESCVYDELYIVPLHFYWVCSLTLSFAINIVIIIVFDTTDKHERKYDWFIMFETSYDQFCMYHVNTLLQFLLIERHFIIKATQYRTLNPRIRFEKHNRRPSQSISFVHSQYSFFSVRQRCTLFINENFVFLSCFTPSQDTMNEYTILTSR